MLLQGGIFLLVTVVLLVNGQDPDQSRTFVELIQSRGFTLQTYSVTTEDGYILLVDRVVPPNYNPANYSYIRKPVIAFHGVLCQSSIFYINSPNLTSGDTFGFSMLLGGKYDLWVPNDRGNGVSMGHVSLNSATDPAYWKFSWEQIALYDIPAVIGLVLQQTRHQSVGYVGYSQGGGAAFALLSLRPQYAHYIKPYIGWAPSVYLGQATSVAVDPLELLQPALTSAPAEFVVTEQWINDAGTALCQDFIAGQPQTLCAALLAASFGNSNSINVTRIPVYFNFFPKPASNWQMAHFAQMFQTGRFARFNYGGVGGINNLPIYGTLQPPDFPLGMIPKNLTTIIFYGNSDNLVPLAGSTQLIATLQGLGMTNVIASPVTADGITLRPLWSHIDYVTGQGAGALVYDKTIAYLDQYTVWDGPV